MKKQSTLVAFGHLVISMLGYALVLGGIGAILSDFFDWNLALSIGGSDIAIPADRYMGVFFLFLGSTISVLEHFWTAIAKWIKKHSLIIIAIFIVIIIAIVYGGKQFIMMMDGGPAMTAAMNGDTTTLEELFEKGEVADEDLDGMMMWTAQKGHADTMKLLLDNGASANATRDDGATALEMACAFGGEEVSQMLIEAGAEGECPEF